MASDPVPPRSELQAALLDLGWWVAAAAIGLLVALSPPDRSAPGPLLLALVLTASAAAVVSLRRGLVRGDSLAFVRAAGWSMLAGGAAAALASFAGGAASTDALRVATPLAGAWLVTGLAIEMLYPVRTVLVGRGRVAVALGLLFVALEIGLAISVFAADAITSVGAPAAWVVAVVLATACVAQVVTARRMTQPAAAGMILSAGLAALGATAASEGAALALLAVAALVAIRSTAVRAVAVPAVASRAEQRIGELGALLADGLFLVDAALDVVALGTSRGGSGSPLELTFVDRDASGALRLTGIVREVQVRRDGGDDVARLTRELHATMGELLDARRTIEDQRAEIERAGHIDPLTGLPNRRAILARLDDEVAQAHRYQHPVAVIVLDVDGLHAVNRAHGLERADAALRELALRLRLRSREADALGRLSGDSFLAILPHTDERGVTTLGEALCRRVAAQPLVDGDQPVSVTLSAGAAVMAAGDDETAEALMSRAEAALAVAVAQGGDQVAFDGLRRLPRSGSRRDDEIGQRAADGTR